MKTYQLTVTEKQLQVIGLACECYGRIQYGQPDHVMLDLPLDFDAQNELTEMCYRFMSKFKELPIEIDEQGNRECDVAFDMWRKIIRKDDFQMGSEPAIKIMEIDDE